MMNSIRKNLMRAFSRKAVRTASLALLAVSMATMAFADRPTGPGYDGCCVGSNGGNYCSAGDNGCQNDYACGQEACGFLWLSTCYYATGVYDCGGDE